MIGFFGALQLILITLKLLGVLTCSWWFITIPLLIEVAAIVVYFSYVVYMSRKKRNIKNKLSDL